MASIPSTVSAFEVMVAAEQVPADSPYRFGDKVLFDRIARILDMTVDEMRPALLRMQRSGELKLARVDMVAGMSVPGALRRSMIRAPGMPETSGWHAVIAPPKSLTRNAAGGETEGHMVFYRVQRAAEHPDSLFDDRRPDGWVDPESENYESQPRGVSACSSLADLRGYMDTYSLTPQNGDRLLRLHGGWGEEDADQFAVRVIVAGWEDIGDARRFWELTREYSRTDLRKDPELTEDILSQCQVLSPNASSHYVWVLPPRSDTPLSEGPYGPMSLERASKLARISASEGAHDRAVSSGSDPEARGFRIVARYAARSGAGSESTGGS